MEPDIVVQLPTELMLLVFGNAFEAPNDGREDCIKLVPAALCPMISR